MTAQHLDLYGLTSEDVRDRNAIEAASLAQWLTAEGPPPAVLKAQRIRDADVNNSPEVIDALYAFFQNCSHLKDWIAKDPESGHTWDEVEAFVKASTPLSKCADLANGSKHFGLQTSAIPKSGIRQTIEGLSSGWTRGGTVKTHAIYIGDRSQGGESTEAFALAEECMEAWDTFLGIK
jgi:hypothetical protein